MEVRRAEVGDVAAIARVIIDGWRSAYTGIVPRSHLDAMSEAGLAEPWTRAVSSGRVKVAVIAGDVVGVVFRGPDRDVGLGEILALYVRSDRRRSGVGRRLVRETALDLIAEGISRLVISTARDNPFAAFYRSVGGHVAAERTERIAGVDVPLVDFVWDDARLLAP